MLVNESPRIPTSTYLWSVDVSPAGEFNGECMSQKGNRPDSQEWGPGQPLETGSEGLS